MKLSLFVDDMIVYMENPIDSTKKLNCIIFLTIILKTTGLTTDSWGISHRWRVNMFFIKVDFSASCNCGIPPTIVSAETYTHPFVVCHLSKTYLELAGKTWKLWVSWVDGTAARLEFELTSLFIKFHTFFFIRNGCCTLWNAFSTSIDMIKWFLSLLLFMWYISSQTCPSKQGT